VDTPQEHHGEQERREGMGARVRRFVDTELSRILDKEDQGAGRPTGRQADPDPADRGSSVDRADDSAPAQESQRAHGPEQERDPEPVDPDAGGPGYADRPVTTAPEDARREPRLAPTGSEKSRGQSGDQLGAEGNAARVGLLNDVAVLCQASVLVDLILDEIRVNVGNTHPSETMSTKDLRGSFQRYREFFSAPAIGVISAAVPGSRPRSSRTGWWTRGRLKPRRL
jgi:hypothetical protein